MSTSGGGHPVVERSNTNGLPPHDLHPGGIAASSRCLSAATPSDQESPENPHAEGVPAGLLIRRLLAALPGCGCRAGDHPVVSLRSTTSYQP